MNAQTGRPLTHQRQNTGVCNNHCIRTRRGNHIDGPGQLCQIARPGHDIDGDKHLNAAGVAVRHRFEQLLLVKVPGGRAHAEFLPRQVDRIGAESDGIPQLFHIAGRREQLGFFHSGTHCSSLRISSTAALCSSSVRLNT